MRRVNVVRALVDIHEPRLRARLGNGLRRRDEGGRHSNDNVARLHSAGHQREPQRIRTTANADTVFRAAELRERVFKLLYQGTANEAGSVQCALENSG